VTPLGRDAAEPFVEIPRKKGWSDFHRTFRQPTKFREKKPGKKEYIAGEKKKLSYYELLERTGYKATWRY